MSDCVLDTSLVRGANEDMESRKPGSLFDKTLAIIEEVANGTWRVRYNPKLLNEYQAQVRIYKNDFMSVFFQILDSAQAVRVERSTLTRQQKAASDKCKWPSHDQHLLAAAIDGNNCCIFVTENFLHSCGDKVLRHFRIHVHHISG
jgi:hypothetical protein